MLPRLWLQQKDLRADLDVGTVVMPAGVLVHGVVHDPSGAPLPHANVRNLHRRERQRRLRGE